MVTQYTPQKRDPYAFTDPNEAGRYTDTAMKADVLGQATSNTGTVIEGSQTGKTAENGAIAPTATNYQQVYTQNPEANTAVMGSGFNFDQNQQPQQPAPEKKDVNVMSSAPANGYIGDLENQRRQAEEQSNYLQLQNYGAQTRGETITDASKSAYVNQLPPVDPNESQQEKDMRKVVENGGWAGLSAGNALTSLLKLRKDREKIDKQQGLMKDAQTSEKATADASAFKMGQSGSSFGDSAAKKLQEKQQIQTDDFIEKRNDFLNSAWSAALSNNYSQSEKFKQEAEKTLQGYLALRDDARAEKETVSKLQQYEDVHAASAQERAQKTIKNLIDNGIDISDVPDSYMAELDTSMGLPHGSASAMWDIGQDERQSKYITDQEELKTKKLNNAKTLMGLMNEIPLGKKISLNGVEYEGLSRGDVKTGTETDQNGRVTFWSHNDLTGETTTTSLGAIGKAVDGWETKMDDNGKAWRLNASTGEQVPFFPSEAQKDWQEKVPEGSISPFKDANGNPRVQCGAFANDMTGIGVGDSFESKMDKMNIWKKGEGDPKSVIDKLQVGDVFTQKLGTWTGHIGISLGAETGPNGEPGIRALESNYPQKGQITSSRFVPLSQIDGIGRGTKLNPMLQSGPDSSTGGPTFGAKTPKGEEPLSADQIMKYGLDVTNPENVGLTISQVKQRLKDGGGKTADGVETPAFEEFARGYEAAAAKDPSITSLNPEALHAIYEKTIAPIPFMVDAATNLSYKFSDKKAPQVVADVKHAIESGDYTGAQDKLKKLALDTADTTTSQQVRGRENSLRAITNIQQNLKDYTDMNGDTSILSGSAEEIRKKIGQVGDEDLRRIATKIQAAIIDYRHAVSGAGFTASEAQQYTDMFPAITNTQALNDANVEALKEIFSQGNETFYRQQLGNQNYDAIFANE